MFSVKTIQNLMFMGFLVFLLNSCGMGADARKYPPQPELRVKKNIEEGRGFRLMDNAKVGGTRNFEFASSNELWRASLDTIDFIPLASVNYSGGIIVTDWYSLPENPNERIKLTIFVVGRELRSDAIRVVVNVQTRDGLQDDWGNNARDLQFSRRLEDLVLNRAREIRAESLTDIAE